MRMNVEFPVFGSDASSIYAKALALLGGFGPEYAIDSMRVDAKPVGVTIAGEILGWRGDVTAVISR